jgi:hypothetical protein
MATACGSRASYCALTSCSSDELELAPPRRLPPSKFKPGTKRDTERAHCSSSCVAVSLIMWDGRAWRPFLHDRHYSGASSFQIGISRGRRMAFRGRLARVLQRLHSTSSQPSSPLRHCAIVGDGCAGPQYPSIRFDHALASARSASRTAWIALLRAPSARIFAPAIREPNSTWRDLVLIRAVAGKNLPVFGNSFPFRTHRERPAMPQGLADRTSIDTQQPAVDNASAPSGTICGRFY